MSRGLADDDHAITPSDLRRLPVGSRTIKWGRGMREMRGERMKREREREERGRQRRVRAASRPHSKKDLGVRAKSLKKSDLVRLLYLPFSYSTTPAVLNMRCR